MMSDLSDYDSDVLRAVDELEEREAKRQRIQRNSDAVVENRRQTIERRQRALREKLLADRRRLHGLAEEIAKLNETASTSARRRKGERQMDGSRNGASGAGHVSKIGKQSGKVVAYDIRLKQCMTCEISFKGGTESSPQVCPKNWTGSSKAMEPSMCVSMRNQLKTGGIPVNKTFVPSTGKHTEESTERKVERNTYQGEYQQCLSFKSRHVEKKEVKREDSAAKGTREEPAYKSGVLVQQFSLNDVTEIPPAVHPPTPEHLPAGHEYTWIYFDLETTGLGLSDVTQLAAKAGDQSFSTYVIPDSEISEEATRITGIDQQDGVLYKDGLPVDAVSLKACIESFTEWLGQFQSPVLVAHKARFDAMVFCNTLTKLNDNIISSMVAGFVDTLSLMREILPHQQSYKQESLVGDVLGDTYSTHDATEDVRLLEKLMVSQQVPYTVMLSHSFKLGHFFACVSYKLQKDENVKTLEVLVQKNVITKSMMNKIAGSGLAYKHLVLAHSRDGIGNVFKECSSGKARVTKCKRIIEKITKYFE